MQQYADAVKLLPAVTAVQRRATGGGAGGASRSASNDDVVAGAVVQYGGAVDVFGGGRVSLAPEPPEGPDTDEDASVTSPRRTRPKTLLRSNSGSFRGRLKTAEDKQHVLNPLVSKRAKGGRSARAGVSSVPAFVRSDGGSQTLTPPGAGRKDIKSTAPPPASVLAMAPVTRSGVPMGAAQGEREYTCRIGATVEGFLMRLEKSVRLDLWCMHVSQLRFAVALTAVCLCFPAPQTAWCVGVEASLCPHQWLRAGAV